jgi:hypothetical protein
MGKMKDLHIDICNANNGELPKDLTLDDAVLMRKWNIYNWEDFQEKCKEYAGMGDFVMQQYFEKFDVYEDLRSSKDELDKF